MSQQAPAGWYPDGTGNERFWDGSAWTEQLRVPATPPPAAPSATAAEAKPAGVFSKMGSAVRRANADRKSAKEEAVRDHEERARAAGALVTSGTFGVSTIEIYEGGYVRVAEGTDGHSTPAEITKKTPYEKLRSITFSASEAEIAAAASAASDAAPGSAIEGAVMQAMSGIMKGGKLLSKGTAVGLATTGIAQFAANASRKSNLIITTDKAIHTLANQMHNGLMKWSRKEDDAVAKALIEAGITVLGIEVEPDPQAAAEVQSATASATGAPTLSDRMRELADLHRDGILSDQEFSDAKVKLLNGL